MPSPLPSQKGAHVDFIDYRVFVPLRVILEEDRLAALYSSIHCHTGPFT